MKSWKDAHLEAIGIQEVISEKIQYKGYPTKYAALHGQLGLKTLAQAKAVDHLIVAGGKKPDQIAKIFKNFGPAQFQDIVDLLNVSTKSKDLKDTEQKLKAGFHHESVKEEINEKLAGYRSSYRLKSKYDGKEFDRNKEIKLLDKMDKLLIQADKLHEDLQYPNLTATVTKIWDHIAEAHVGIMQYKEDIKRGEYDGLIDMDD